MPTQSVEATLDRRSLLRTPTRGCRENRGWTPEQVRQTLVTGPDTGGRMAWFSPPGRWNVAGVPGLRLLAPRSCRGDGCTQYLAWFSGGSTSRPWEAAACGLCLRADFG